MSSTSTCQGYCSTPNQLPPCPIRMQDARAFTDYRPRCAVNAELLNELAIQNMVKSSYESRMFLQQKADMLMMQDQKKAVDMIVPCAPCNRPFSDPGTMEPERYSVFCDSVSCSRTEVNPLGIGDGRRY